MLCICPVLAPVGLDGAQQRPVCEECSWEDAEAPHGRSGGFLLLVYLAPGCRTVLVIMQMSRLLSTGKGLRESRGTAGRGVGTELTVLLPPSLGYLCLLATGT